MSADVQVGHAEEEQRVTLPTLLTPGGREAAGAGENQVANERPGSGLAGGGRRVATMSIVKG